MKMVLIHIVMQIDRVPVYSYTIFRKYTSNALKFMDVNHVYYSLFSIENGVYTYCSVNGLGTGPLAHYLL